MKISLITTTRDDLFDVSHAVAQAIDPAFYQDRDNPVVLGVRGSFKSGKKIVTDAVREKLLGSTALCHFQGVPGIDEYWFGKPQRSVLEVDYMDTMYARGFHHKSLDAVDGLVREDAFFQQRKFGGITLIQNKEQSPRDGINIWVESAFGLPVNREEKPRARHGDLAMAFRCAIAFDTEAKRFAADRSECHAMQSQLDKEWVRYVEIEVHDARLKNSSKFQAGMGAIAASAHQVSQALTARTSGIVKPLPLRPYRKP